MKREVCILGAGPAGLTSAYFLAKSGYTVHLVETSKQVGGMCRSLKLWDHIVDLGPHRFFTKDKRVNAFWLEIIDNNFSFIRRKTRLLYQGTLFRYPLEPVDTLCKLPFPKSISSMISYGLRPKKGNVDSFENWVICNFGKVLYETFFRSYTEKLWGLPCNQLDSEFAKQRIKNLSLSNALRAFLDRKAREEAEYFPYPLQGTGAFYEALYRKIPQQNIRTYFGQRPTRIDIRSTGVTVSLSNQRSISATHLITTIPLTHFLTLISGTPDAIKRESEQLAFRNTVLVYLQIDSSNLFSDTWIYINDPSLRLGRVTNFHNWSPALWENCPNSTVLCLEFWCSDTDPFWQTTDTHMIAVATSEIRKSGLLGNASVLDGRVIRLLKSYPVYTNGYKESLALIRKHIDLYENVSVIGRGGAFKYNNQDHSIWMGMQAAENVQKNGPAHDLWSTNADYIYNESSYIGRSGHVATELSCRTIPV